MTSDFVLRNIDLEIPFGSKIALIGANGSGKSSLIHLICRFYDPQHGRCVAGRSQSAGTGAGRTCVRGSAW